MLAGLLIATHDADDRPGMLTATLPFGGMTLIEYQARLLVGAGASQIVVMVARLTPELIGAINRIGRRGVTVDTVRSAAEAADKLHPLARLLLLADGLTTTDATIRDMARDGGDALLVVSEHDLRGDYERIGSDLLWAGIARLDPRRVAELARLPRDYDVQSTLVRLASQARAIQVMLSPQAVRNGHGIEHGGTTLQARGRGVLAATARRHTGWFDRLVVAPLATSIIPPLVRHAVPSIAVGGVAGLATVLAGGLAWFDHAAAALALALLGCAVAAVGVVLADLRDEAPLTRGLDPTVAIAAALVLIHGHRESIQAATSTPGVMAVALVTIAGLAEQARGRTLRPFWWGSGPGYLLILLAGALLDASVAALAIAGLYATITAVAAIARLRQEP